MMIFTLKVISMSLGSDKGQTHVYICFLTNAVNFDVSSRIFLKFLFLKQNYWALKGLIYP